MGMVKSANSGDIFAAYSVDDTNGNGKWDTGESFTDGNGDGVYTPDEYIDFNNNNQYDAGLDYGIQNSRKDRISGESERSQC